MVPKGSRAFIRDMSGNDRPAEIGSVLGLRDMLITTGKANVELKDSSFGLSYKVTKPGLFWPAGATQAYADYIDARDTRIAADLIDFGLSFTSIIGSKKGGNFAGQMSNEPVVQEFGKRAGGAVAGTIEKVLNFDLVKGITGETIGGNVLRLVPEEKQLGTFIHNITGWDRFPTSLMGLISLPFQPPKPIDIRKSDHSGVDG